MIVPKEKDESHEMSQKLSRKSHLPSFEKWDNEEKSLGWRSGGLDLLLNELSM